MNPERYSPEQAQEEAARMNAKIESGGASSYDEAEELVEQKGPQLSLVSLKQTTEELKGKVEAAKLQREKDVKQKISERESLIGEAKKNDELLGAAREALEYFVSMQELGQLDKADAKRLEELQTLVSSLEGYRVEIEKKIAIISSRPEILEKLQDAAKKEDAERTTKSLVEQSRAELEPQVDQLATAIKNLASRDVSLSQLIERQQSAASGAWNKIADAFGRARDMLSEKSNFGYTLQQIFRDSRAPEELQQKLTEARKSLGMFKGKEKAAVDFILAQTQVFDEYHRTAEQLSSLKQQRESLKNEKAGLAEQFRAMLVKSWEVQEKISELGGTPSGMGLPNDLWYRLQHQIEKFADLRRWEGDQKVGKYEGWFNATRTAEGRALYNTLQEVTENAGGYGLTMRNPNKPERENQK